MKQMMELQASAKVALDAHEAFMGGKDITAEQEAIHDAITKAGCYAIAAYEAHSPKSGGECSTLIWAFLTALVDPLSKELDALRANPAAGEAARAERKKSN